MEQARHANSQYREAVVTHAHLFVTACVCVCAHVLVCNDIIWNLLPRLNVHKCIKIVAKMQA